MQKKLILFFVSLLFLIIVFAAIVQIGFSSDQSKTYAAPSFAIQELVASADVKLGERLYAIRSGCIDCHGADLSGALIMDNVPMGSIYGANITPYSLSQWTDEEIASAIRYGIHRSGRSLQFMPSFDFAGLSIGDTAALVAYLKSVPSVEKPNHQNHFGLVAKLLSFAGKMPVMFPAKAMDLSQGFGEKPPEGPTFEFGRYLANSCTGCHGSNMQGGKIAGGDPSWPEASDLRLGANPIWTEARFQEVIQTGISALTQKALKAPMPVKLVQQFNDTEVKALWIYLSSLK